MEPLILRVLKTSEVESKEEELLSYVSSERKEKALSYAFRKDRLLSLGAAYFLRRYVPGPLLTGPYGKLLSPSLHFSLSHSGDTILFLASSSPCGVDIEAREKPIEGLRGYAFSALEASRLLKGNEILDAWTRKEALAKAEGSGFALTPIKEIPSEEGEVLYLSKTYVVKTLPSRLFKAHVSLAYEKIGAEELLVNRIEERIEIPSLS